MKKKQKKKKDKLIQLEFDFKTTIIVPEIWRDNGPIQLDLFEQEKKYA